MTEGDCEMIDVATWTDVLYTVVGSTEEVVGGTEEVEGGAEEVCTYTYQHTWVWRHT